MDLQSLLNLNIYVVMMSFARVGAAFSMMPGFSATAVPARARLLLAIWVAVVISPMTAPLFPPEPTDPATLLVQLGYEMIVGLFFALFAQLMMAGLHTAGAIIAYLSSMANAFTADALAGSQSSVASSLLTQVGLVLLFATGMDHLMLQAIFESYSLFPPGGVIPAGDMVEFYSHAFDDSFGIAMQLAAPFVTISVVLQFALGLLNKLMPQLPVFFVAMPLQIGVALTLFTLALPAMMMVFLQYYENGLEAFINP